MKDLKFDMWIEIQKNNFDDKWSISFCIHPVTIYEENFFIDGYPVDLYVEDEKERSSQTFKFNSKLFKEIQKLLLPNSKKHYLSVPQDVAWDYYHYTCYEGFMFNVHPVSMTGDYLRQSFIGTQEEVYNKCKQLNEKWISKNKNLS